MELQDTSGDRAENGSRSFIAMTRAEFDCLSVEDEETCPRCGANDKVRGSTNRWLCRRCNRSWNRKINWQEDSLSV